MSHFYILYFQGYVSHKNLEELNLPVTPLAGLPGTSLRCFHSHFQTKGVLQSTATGNGSSPLSSRPRKYRLGLCLRVPWPLLSLWVSLDICSPCPLPASTAFPAGFLRLCKDSMGGSSPALPKLTTGGCGAVSMRLVDQRGLYLEMFYYSKLKGLVILLHS